MWTAGDGGLRAAAPQQKGSAGPKRDGRKQPRQERETMRGREGAARTLHRRGEHRCGGWRRGGRCTGGELRRSGDGRDLSQLLLWTLASLFRSQRPCRRGRLPRDGARRSCSRRRCCPRCTFVGRHPPGGLRRRLIRGTRDRARETEILQLARADIVRRGGGRSCILSGRSGGDEQPACRPNRNSQAPSAPHLFPPKVREIAPIALGAAGTCPPSRAYSSTARMNRTGIQPLSARRPGPARRRPPPRCRAWTRR